MASTSRSLSLSETLNSRLLLVCEELGVTPNNYINNVVAKALLKDVTYIEVRSKSADSLNYMNELFERIADESQADD